MAVPANYIQPQIGGHLGDKSVNTNVHIFTLDKFLYVHTLVAEWQQFVLVAQAWSK